MRVVSASYSGRMSSCPCTPDDCLPPYLVGVVLPVEGELVIKTFGVCAPVRWRSSPATKLADGGKRARGGGRNLATTNARRR